MITVVRRAPADLVDEALDVAVVIDVFRATSTATVLLGRGVDEVAVVAGPADLPLLPAEVRYLVFSERTDLSTHLPAVDNSPAVAWTVPLDGRVPLLVTTNGTRALCAAARVARRVLVGSFLNVAALARHLVAGAPAHVTLIPAGDVERAERHVEDEACADALEALLHGDEPGWRELEERCRADARLARRIGSGAGLRADAAVAFAVNDVPVAAEFRYHGRVGRIFRVS
jgi:phosphosulfolactate phosphohydrolase-like enzyme